MKTKEIKQELKQNFPNVYKATRAWLIKDDMDNIKAGARIRSSLHKKGFRKIEDNENMGETLQEAEDWLEP